MYKLLFKYDFKYFFIILTILFLLFPLFIAYLVEPVIIYFALFLAIFFVNDNTLIKYSVFKDFTHFSVFPLSYKQKYEKLYWIHFFSPKIIWCNSVLFCSVLLNKLDIFTILFLIYFYIIYNFFSVFLCAFGRRSNYGIRIIPEILSLSTMILLSFCGMFDMGTMYKTDSWHYILLENINNFFININIIFKILFFILFSLLPFWCYFATKKVIEKIPFFDMNIVKSGATWEKYFSKNE